MKSSLEKSSITTSPTAIRAASLPFFTRAGGGNFFAPLTKSSAVQTKMTVNKPGDKFEQEADTMAAKVMRIPTTTQPVKEKKLQQQTDDKIQKAALPEEKIQKEVKEEDKIQKATLPEEKVQKATMPEEKVQKKEEEKLQRDSLNSAPTILATIQSAIQNRTTGGQPLPTEVRSYMEPRFNADFSNVRVHSDPESASLSNQLSARAFTYQNHVFFSREQYQPGTSEGKQLLAHELTHTIQQGHAVQRVPQVSTTVTQPHIQRSAISEILDWFANKAINIPGFRMLTIILGMNPINMSTVDHSTANILRALIEFIPGGAFITTALDNHGVFNKVADWIEKQIKALGMVGQMFKTALTKFVDSLGLSDLLPWNWGSVWERAKNIFTAPIDRLISFAKGVVTDILKFIKDAILKPLAALAKGTNGYDLLRAILGEDPITGEPVPRNADTLIGGFMKFIGQQEIWENIKKGNAVARAWAWFQGTLSGLLGFVRSIPKKIIDTITSLTIQDIVTVAGAFGKIVGAFANIAVDFISWGLKQVLSLLEILFSVVAPGVMPYLKKAQTAFMTILKNPIGFVGNLVKAGKMGFEMFASRIGEHLKTALIKWIVGPLAEAGVYIPSSFSLIEIIKLVLSVLGLTWQNIRSKLVKIIPEPVLVGLEKTAGILVTLVKDGPAAAWEQIKAELTELKDQLISQMIQMVTTEVVKAAIIKLVSMLNPAGAVIQAIIAIYNTITFFIQKINQIAAVVASFIDSISAIAAGQVENAAKKVEQTMANTLTIIIAFLAKFAGLGNIPEKIVGIIKRIRQPIDKGLDKIAGWLAVMLKKMMSSVAQAGLPADPKERARLGMDASVLAVNKYANKKVGKMLLDPLLSAIKIRYGFKTLDLQKDGEFWSIAGSMSPTEVKKTQALADTLGSKASSVPVFGPLISGFGTSVKVSALTSNHPSGSGPSVEGGHWDILRQRMDGGSTYYVRGHLLNDNLGGTGGDWQNLTPLTQATNNRSAVSMLHTFESKIKTSVAEGKTIDFSVIISYGRPARTNEAAKVKTSLPQDEGEKIADIILAEQNVPTSVQGSANEIDATGKSSPLIKSTVMNTLDTNMDHYEVTRSKRRLVNLNTCSDSELMDLNGVNALVASQIKTLRPISNKDEMRKKLNNDQIWHAMVSTAGVSIRF